MTSIRLALVVSLAAALLAVCVPVRAATAQAAEGETQVSLPLPEPLTPGAYALAVKAGGRALSHDITLVTSPSAAAPVMR